MADISEVLMSVLSTIRVPKPGDRVHKDECALSFASPVSILLSQIKTSTSKHCCFDLVLCCLPFLCDGTFCLGSITLIAQLSVSNSEQASVKLS